MLVIIACAIFAAVARDLLYAAIALAIMSVMLALEFYILQAPDVAMAEAAIGAVITTALFVITIRATKRME